MPVREESQRERAERLAQERTEYAHVIVDEAQDLTLLQLRAMMRRAEGVTLVGDDAQRRRASGIGLRRAAELLETGLESMATAYRMSAEIADWLNDYPNAEIWDLGGTWFRLRVPEDAGPGAAPGPEGA